MGSLLGCCIRGVWLEKAVSQATLSIEPEGSVVLAQERG